MPETASSREEWNFAPRLSAKEGPRENSINENRFFPTGNGTKLQGRVLKFLFEQIANAILRICDAVVFLSE